MTAIEPLLQSPAARALAWALLHFVWQGTLVALVAAAALGALRRSAADVRYIVASVGLTLMLTLPAVTAAQRWQTLTAGAGSAARISATAPAAPHVPSDHRRGVETLVGVAPAAAPAFADRLPRVDDRRIEPFVPLLLLAWLSGVAILSVRLLAGCVWIRRLRLHGIHPAAEKWTRIAARLARQMHIRRSIALVESALVDVPTVIGCLKPIVLLPVSALTALSPQQVEAILAHELAHIRRHDYAVNLLQSLVETLLFYHPAVWWLSRRIRVERENCCDDLAVSLCGDPVAYADALADLEMLRRRSHGARQRALTPNAGVRRVTLAATGGALLHRVRRLLGVPASHAGQGPVWLAGSAALVLLFGIAIAADGLRQPQAATPARIASSPVPRIAAAPAAPTPAAAAVEPQEASTTGSANAPALAQVDEELAALAKARDEAMRAQAAAESQERSRLAEADAMRAQTEDLTARASAMAHAATPALAAGGDAATAAAMAAVRVEAAPVQDQSSGNWIWSNDGEKLEVSYSGRFEFTDDDADVRVLSPGGRIHIADSGAAGRHAIEIRERGGTLERKYYVNGSERPFDPEGRQWLRDNLRKLIRNSGIGADKRVARFLKSGGPPAVLAEISKIEGSYGKRLYFTELFKQASLTAEQYRQAMLQASREIKGDYDLASLLISIADRLPGDEASRAAYFTAASGIRSDYEITRVYSTMLKRGSVAPGVLAAILERAGSIGSDYQLSELLRQIVGHQPLDDRTQPLFFKALGTVQGDYERHRILSAAIAARPADTATLTEALNRAAEMHGGYDLAAFLLEALAQNGAEGPLRPPFFAAVDRISGSYDRGRVLQAVARKEGTSRDTMLAVVNAAAKMPASYDRAQVLLAVASSTVPLTGGLRDAYIDAAGSLHAYEQGQVMTALVKNERGR
jgi:beta-lactamase regulating signal transducer with metallopeptidase domain